MARIVLAFLLFLWFLALPLLAEQPSWTKTVERVEKSLVALTGSFPQDPQPHRPFCTGFYIDRLRYYVLTAQHCVSVKDLKVDGHAASVVWAQEKYDFVVLNVNSKPKPALTPNWTVKKGELIGALGYGYRLEQTVFRSSRVAVPALQWDGEDVPHITFDKPFIGGMSGGPVFNESGAVVGLITSSDLESGWAIPIFFIYRHTKQFWGFSPFQVDTRR